MLFEVNIETKESKSTKFISKLQNKGFIGKNEIYLKNYIDADIAIALSHIKTNYEKYVCKGAWDEEKFEGILFVLIQERKMLSSGAFMKYGILYDEGKLRNKIAVEQKKYKVYEAQDTNQDISKEEQELLDYIAQNGGE